MQLTYPALAGVNKEQAFRQDHSGGTRWQPASPGTEHRQGPVYGYNRHRRRTRHHAEGDPPFLKFPVVGRKGFNLKNKQRIFRVDNMFLPL